MFALVNALDSGDPPNPWSGGIPDPIWWLSCRCVDLGGSNAGIYADKPGFHNTVKNNQAKWPTNYSVNPAIPVLLLGPHDKARAFDWMFPEAQTKNYVRINQYCARLLAASKARDPRLAGLYEWFGTNDGANIGWNLWRNQPSSSDDTHDWHIHFSFITAYVLLWAVAHGVLSVLMDETLEAYLARGGQLINKEGTDDMALLTDADVIGLRFQDPRIEAIFGDLPAARFGPEKGAPNKLHERLNRIEAKLDQLLAAPAGTVDVTEAQLDHLAVKIGEALLGVEADADEARAKVLRAAVGS